MPFVRVSISFSPSCACVLLDKSFIVRVPLFLYVRVFFAYYMFGSACIF